MEKERKNTARERKRDCVHVRACVNTIRRVQISTDESRYAAL